MGIGRDLVEIASLLIGVALVALILNPKANTVPVIQTGGSVFNNLLQTVTLQNMGQAYGGSSLMSGGNGMIR